MKPPPHAKIEDCTTEELLDEVVSRLPVVAIAVCLPDDNQSYRCLTYKKGLPFLVLGITTALNMEARRLVRLSRRTDHDDD